MAVPRQEPDLLQIPTPLLINSIRSITFIASPSDVFEEWDSWTPVSAPIDIGDLPPATPGCYEQYLTALFAAVEARLAGSPPHSFARLEASQREKLLAMLSCDDFFRDARFADARTRAILSIRLVQAICLAQFHPQFEPRLSRALKQMRLMVVQYARMCDFFYEQTRRTQPQAPSTESVPPLARQATAMSTSIPDVARPSESAVCGRDGEERARPLPQLSPRKSEAPSYLSTTLPRPEGLVPLRGKRQRPEEQRAQPLTQTIPAELPGRRRPMLHGVLNRTIVPDPAGVRPPRVLYRVHHG
jgi:hypothetical protein